jgi:hypothetical protein
MISNAMVLEQEATQAQIQRIVQSKAFRTSEVHRNLLTYLAEKSLAGEADNVKEYSLGLDVFGKPESYDPRQESTVRMHVGRLRQKLAEYYRTEGVADAIIVDLPKGGFRVTFESRPVPEVAVSQPAGALRHTLLDLTLATGLCLALGVAGFLGYRLWNVATVDNGPEMTPELQELWGPLLSSNKPLVLCLATPSSNFPGVGAASGAFLLGQFLSKHHNVVLTPSDELSAPESAMGHVVFLGPMSGNRQLQAVPAKVEINLEAEGVRVLKPRKGEEALLKDRLPADSLDIEESYALISHLPGLYSDGEILYISGNRAGSIMGGVKAFTDSAFARTLLGKLRQESGKVPRFYQIVIKVRAMDNMPLDYTYVLHRGLTASASSGSGRP